MGCLNSKPVPNESNDNNRHESIEITEQESGSNLLRKDSLSNKETKPVEQTIKIENETTNVLLTKRESLTQSEQKTTSNLAPPETPKVSPPVESPKSQRPQRESLDSSSEKKLKLSELLHAEKMKKTSSSISSSGEVASIRYVLSFSCREKRAGYTERRSTHFPMKILT